MTLSPEFLRLLDRLRTGEVTDEEMNDLEENIKSFNSEEEQMLRRFNLRERVKKDYDLDIGEEDS